MRETRKTLEKRVPCCGTVLGCPQPGWEQKRSGAEGGRGVGARATLTRGGPHAGRPELPQDEALLTLSQGQEELVGFYALLAATQARAPQLWQTRGPFTAGPPARFRPPVSPAVPSAQKHPGQSRGHALLSCAPPLPFLFKLASRKIQDTTHMGEASSLPFA